jgi:hypothetical protein
MNTGSPGLCARYFYYIAYNRTGERARDIYHFVDGIGILIFSQVLIFLPGFRGWGNPAISDYKKALIPDKYHLPLSISSGIKGCMLSVG